MAGYNEILVGRFARALQKITGIKGSVPTATLSSDVAATLDLTLIPIEERYLSAFDVYAVNQGSAAVAAQNSAVRIRNPAGSNVIAVLEYLAITVGPGVAADTVSVGRQTGVVDFAGPVTGLRVDSRMRPNSTLLVSTSNNILNANVFLSLNLATGLSTQVILTNNQEIPVLPNDAITFTTATLNEVLIVSFRWRERFLEESERI